MATVGECRAVLRLAPSADKLLVSGQPFRHHDEGNIVGRSVGELQRFHHTFMAMRSKHGIIIHEPYSLCGSHVASAGRNHSATSIASWIST